MAEVAITCCFFEHLSALFARNEVFCHLQDVHEVLGGLLEKIHGILQEKGTLVRRRALNECGIGCLKCRPGQQSLTS